MNSIKQIYQDLSKSYNNHSIKGKKRAHPDLNRSLSVRSRPYCPTYTMSPMNKNTKQEVMGGKKGLFKLLSPNKPIFVKNII